MTTERSPLAALIRIMDLVGPCNMEGVFTTLLGLARSQQHLRKLHDEVLPANCRLLRTDYLVLERAWKALHQNSSKDQISADETQAIECALKAALGSFKGYTSSSPDGKENLVDYYYVKVNGGDHLPEGFQSGLPRILFGEQWPKSDWFTGKLFGCQFSFFFGISEDHTRLALRMYLDPADLTEALTHALLTRLPSAKASWGVNWCWSFVIADSISDLHDPETLGVVQQILCSNGVPVESLASYK